MIDQTDDFSSDPDPPFADAVGSEALQNDFLRGRNEVLDDGLFGLQGGEAVAGAPAAERRLGELRDGLIARAGSDRQRAMLADDLDAHMDVARDAIARHVAAQTKTWDRNVRADRVGLLQDLARREYDDPGHLPLYAEAAAGAAGERPDEARSGVWRSAIDGALDDGAHGAALELYERAREHLTADDETALRPQLAIARQMQQGWDYLAALLPLPMPATLAATDEALARTLELNDRDWAHDPEQLATNKFASTGVIPMSEEKDKEFKRWFISAFLKLSPRQREYVVARAAWYMTLQGRGTYLDGPPSGEAAVRLMRINEAALRTIENLQWLLNDRPLPFTDDFVPTSLLEQAAAAGFGGERLCKILLEVVEPRKR